MNCSFSDTVFGRAIIASTEKGVCFLAFGENDDALKTSLQNRFCKAKLKDKTDAFQQAALAALNSNDNENFEVVLHISGTDFQLKVWSELLKIQSGKLATYAEVAQKIGRPKSCRATANAIGANPVAYFIPCHRVVRTDGGIGGYRWGIERKKKMLAMEKL
jgi:AraC family transcriptional regulator of adaptative response/methylated-DNA-[protein]-cysteine methyltransferase